MYDTIARGIELSRSEERRVDTFPSNTDRTLDLYATCVFFVEIVSDVVYCDVHDFVDIIVSNFVVYCQIRDFVDNIAYDFVVYCQTHEFVNQILTLVSMCAKRINCGVIFSRLLLQHQLLIASLIFVLDNCV